MHILTLNGSPKGEISVSYQYMRYLEQENPDHRFETLHIAQQARKFRDRESYRQEVLEKIRAADLIIFCFPLYFMTVNSRYMEFLELMLAEHQDALEGTYAASISTSIHFADHIAQEYIRGFCADTRMEYIEGITAKMDDLLDASFRRSFVNIFSSWRETAASGAPTAQRCAPVRYESSGYRMPPELSVEAISPDRRICIVTDGCAAEESPLEAMVQTLRRKAPDASLVYLRDLTFGPCMGCLHCGFDNQCIYEGKDEFLPVYRETILPSDIIIFALPAAGRYFSSVFQRYLERTFVYNHQRTLTGKQILYVVSGPLSQDHLLQEALTLYTETMGGQLAGMISDEQEDPLSTARLLQDSLELAVLRSEQQVIKPMGFLGVGGMKIFRDDIFSHLRFVFQKDHQSYKKQGLYDFPHKRRRQRMGTSLATAATRVPMLRPRIQSMLKEGMIRPYQKLFSETTDQQ
jgi:multimeric flavodoxin WrbA